MFKKCTSTILSSLLFFASVSADVNYNSNVGEELKQLKAEVYALSETLNQELNEQGDVGGKKKEMLQKALSKVKIKDDVLNRFTTDCELSDKVKSKVVKELRKVKELASSKIAKKEKAEIQVEDNQTE